MGEIRKHLTREQIGLLCELYANGLTAKQTSKMFSVSTSTIDKIIRRHYNTQYKNPMILVLDSKV